MQITKTNSINYNYNSYSNYKRNTPQNTNYSNANFGFRLGCLKDVFMKPETKNYIKFFVEQISTNMNVSKQQVEKYVTPKQPERMLFFKDMADKISADFFHKKIEEPDNAFEQMEELYRLIPKPDKLHKKILNESTYTFEDAAKLLKLSQESKENYKLLKQLTSVKRWDINNLNIRFAAQDLVDLIKSPNSKKLTENFEDYRSFISLNHQKPNFVQELLEDLSKETSTISAKEMDMELAVKQIKHGSALMIHLPDELIKNSWNKEGFDLLSRIDIPVDYIRTKTPITDEKNLAFYEHLIKTTTKENLQERILLFKNFSGFYNEENSIEVVGEVLNRIDNDKNFKQLFNGIAQSNCKITHKPLTELLYYTDIFGSDVLAKKSKNLIKIINANTGYDKKPEQVVDVISKNLNNKHYVSPSKIDSLRQAEYLKKMTAMFFPETKAKLMRLRRKFKYDLMPKIFGTGKPLPVKQSISYEEYVKSFTKPANTQHTEIPADKLSVPMDLTKPKLDLTKPIQQAAEAPADAPKLKIKRDYKARKLQIQQDAQEIIKSRMRSAKQIQEQIGDYTKKATKMRNQFLNAMFNSVAETRAQQRAQGIKRPKISNYDVLEVYKQINGKNKKLFRTLLKARNENGEQVYDLKQISQILEKDRLEQLALKKQNAVKK